MKKACLVVQKPYLEDQIFNSESPLNRDECLKFFHELKTHFLKKEILLRTQDLHPVETSDYVLYNEMPKVLPSIRQKSFALLFESELIRPDNWRLDQHDFFNKIFTWNDQLVDGQKYIKFNFTHAGQTQFVPFSLKKKFCTLIAGNKSVQHPLELYSKRVETIRWFESHQPLHFDFYGMGWNYHQFKVPVLSKVLNRVKFLQKLGADSWPSYRGPVHSKLQLLKDYKFSICYENAFNIPGYITEKIFDSMAAGCIPVYWGAPNIADYIPAECFVDRTKFVSHQELFDFLSQMTEAEYSKRQAAILEYLKSDKHRAFEPSPVAQVVVEAVVRG